MVSPPLGAVLSSPEVSAQTCRQGCPLLHVHTPLHVLSHVSFDTCRLSLGTVGLKGVCWLSCIGLQSSLPWNLQKLAPPLQSARLAQLQADLPLTQAFLGLEASPWCVTKTTQHLSNFIASSMMG